MLYLLYALKLNSRRCGKEKKRYEKYVSGKGYK